MKIFKNPIFMFILGLIVSGSVVYAATQISAENIKYDNTYNVKEKIDELYGVANSLDGKSDTINIPSDFSLSTYDYDCGFEPSFIYVSWSNNYAWLLLDNNVYVYERSNGTGYAIINNAITTSNNGFSLNVNNYPGLKGLTADIYAVK